MKKALILGITGQDGSYLAELLLDKGYAVTGLTRRTSVDNRARLKGIIDKISLREGDLTDAASLWRAVSETQPDEVYNLAAQSHVHTSFAQPEYTGNVNALGTVRLLEAIRSVNPKIKFYQASTSELFGQGTDDGKPLNEESLMQPVSPYGAAKLYAFSMVRLYRQAYGLFACNGILFNHESPRRGGDFVTLKIAAFAKSIKDKTWDGTPLRLGNLDARRDWGHARDYVEGMWRMLQQETPSDYVLATGKAFSVREFAEKALSKAGVTPTWSDKGAVDETGRALIEVDAKLFRPVDVQCLLGDSTRAQQQLGWKPSCTIEDLLDEMMA